jgi:HK97 family phage prohead protease
MSDATPDRMGDVIDPNGWSLANFRNNPIALFSHSSSLPIGVWKNVRVEGGKLLGELEMLPEGRSPRVDEIRAFVETGMLRAVSVGFRPIAYEPLPSSKNGGVRYTSSELLECSVVSIPANPNALQVARSLNLSSEAQGLIFGKSADEIESIVRRGAPGETAAKSLPRKSNPMTTLSERIEAAQTEIVTLKGQLTEQLKGDAPDDVVIVELSDQIEKKEAGLAALRRAETALGTKAADPIIIEQRDVRRPFATVAKKVNPLDLLFKGALVQVVSRATQRSPMEVLKERYGEDEQIKVMFDAISRSATAPAMTTTTGWAAELVQTGFADFLDALMPLSIYPVLRDKGGKFTFGQNGIVALPTRAATPTIA